MTRNGYCTDLYIKLARVLKLGAILGLCWGSLGALLGPSWSSFLAWGSLEVLLGLSWSPLGALLGRLGAFLGLFWRV
eukprot:4877730-Pyramimonas_sp.AAC.1